MWAKVQEIREEGRGGRVGAQNVVDKGPRDRDAVVGTSAGGHGNGHLEIWIAKGFRKNEKIMNMKIQTRRKGFEYDANVKEIRHGGYKRRPKRRLKRACTSVNGFGKASEKSKDKVEAFDNLGATICPAFSKAAFAQEKHHSKITDDTQRAIRTNHLKEKVTICSNEKTSIGEWGEALSVNMREQTHCTETTPSVLSVGF